jgi:hypothetical protein
MLSRLGRLLRRAVLRTERGPLRAIWSLAHWQAIRAAAAWAARGFGPAEVYLKGGFGFGRPVYGLSDIDVIVVVHCDPARPGATRERATNRWRTLRRRVPLAGELFDLWVYEDAELRDIGTDTYLTYGRPAEDHHLGRPAFLGSAPADQMKLLDHPGLYGPGRDWRRLGSRRVPPEPVEDAVHRTVFGWLELRFLWAFAFRAAVRPSAPHVAYLCQKLVADSARIWLSLEAREVLFDRDASLASALRLMPEEEAALHMAIELGRKLPRSPEPPLADALPFLVRTSSRIAACLANAAGEFAATEVRLRWGGEAELLLPAGTRSKLRSLVDNRDGAALLPLADWRACAIPALPDETFALIAGDPADPARLAEAALREGSYPALRAERLLVLPHDAISHRGRLRGVECRASDPVSFALADGATSASFPGVPGWSAPDRARRAVAEHRAWLELEAERLLSGIRAGWKFPVTPPKPG